MKARYHAMEGRVEFEIEGATAKEVFSQISDVQEVFDAEPTCGLCGSKDIKFTVRESQSKIGKQQTYTYYELRCRGNLKSGDPCRGRFDFGQSLDTENLFPKRKDADGNWMPNRGWYRYQPQSTSEPMPGPRAEPQGLRWQDAATPDGMQPSFDRIAELYGDGRAIPTTMPAALNLLRAKFSDASAEHIFMVKWRAHNSTGLTTSEAKELLKNLVDALGAISGRPAGRRERPGEDG